MADDCFLQYAYIIAAYTLLKIKFPNSDRNSAHRKKFLIQLSRELVEDQIVSRLGDSQRIHKRTTNAIRLMGFSVVEVPENSINTRKRTRCAICPRSNDNKVNTHCSCCRKYVCKEHMRMICIDCENQDDSNDENSETE